MSRRCKSDKRFRPSRSLGLCCALLMLAATSSAVRPQTAEPSSVAPSFPLFTIKSYLGRCLNMTPPVLKPEISGLEPALSMADCDGSVRQQFGVQELDQNHHVRLHGGGACIEAAAATDGAAVALQPCSSSAGQIFDLDGDSILLDTNPDLVVQLKDSVTEAGTPVALGRRWLSDVEFWDFTSLSVPRVRRPAGSSRSQTAPRCRRRSLWRDPTRSFRSRPER